MKSPPASPIRTRRPSAVPPGFLAPKRKTKTIAQLTILELHDQYRRNAVTLASLDASTSALAQRLSTEQLAIQKRLIGLEGVDDISAILRNTRVSGEDEMPVDMVLPADPPSSRSIQAKQKALAHYAPPAPSRPSGSLSLNPVEAVALEQQAHALDAQRRQRYNEKKKQQGLPIKGEVLTREEQEARIWAFMNYKPTESDLDDDDDYMDEEEDDPAYWFEDDQDDGRKGQDIVEPDFDLSHLIRVDYNKIPHTTLDPPEDEGD